MSAEDDAALLAAASSDAAAFARFYDRYEAPIAGYFLRRTRDPEVAADLTAEVFAAALGAADRYRSQAPTAAVWLFTIARNTLWSSMRRGRVQSEARRRLGMARVELAENSMARLEEADGDRWVAQMLEQLPADQAAAIRSRVLDERGYPEIADELGISEMVIRKRVSRGLATLRKRTEVPNDPAA